MKKVLLPIIALLLLICSCHRRPVYPSQLLEADSLCSVQPDSAIALLEELKAENAQWVKATQMYHNLLTVKAHDKAFITHTSDSMMLQVLSYYEHGGDKQLLPEAYYYMGSTYRDLNDAPRALEYYQKALEVMPEGASPLRRYVNNQMGWLFYRQKLYDEALSHYQQSFSNDSILGDKAEMASDLVNIGTIYNNKNMYPASLERYKLARELVVDKSNNTIIDEIDTQIAGLLVMLGEYEEAKFAIKSPLSHVDLSTLNVYSIAADIYYKLGLVDTASLYYNKVLEIGNIYGKRAANEHLGMIALQENRVEGASQYLTQFRILTDSIQRITATETVAQMNSLYNYQLHIEKANKAIVGQKNAQLLVLLLSLLLLLLVAFVVLLYMRFTFRHKQKSLELVKAKSEQEHLQKLIDDHLNTIEQLKKEQKGQSANINQLNNIIKEKELLVSQYREQSVEISNHYFKKTEWYKDLLNRSSDVKNPKLLRPFTEKEQEELKHEVFNIYSSYISQLKSNYPELDDDKLLLLCLDALKLKGLSIALCFGFTDPHVIYTRKARLREEMGIEMDSVT